MSLTKIAIIGANGTLGPHILKALLAAASPSFQVTVLSRQSSKSTYPASVHVASLPDSLPSESLVSALTGQDALVISFSGYEIDLSLKVVAAAVDAGVARIIPADFGSCDSSDPHTLDVIPLYPGKKKVRDRLIELVSHRPSSSWTSIICGHFLDFGLQTKLMQFDIPNRKARIFDGGDKRFSASVLRTVGAATVAVLQHPEETKNKLIYVQSVSTTQNQLLKVVEKVTDSKFEIEPVDSDAFLDELKVKYQRDPKDHDVAEDLVGVEGIVNGDWTVKNTFMNGVLGLPDEDLERIVRDSLA